MKKISKAKIALTYATALLEAAVLKKTEVKVFADVENLRKTLAEDTALVKYMASPLWPDDDKKAVLAEVAKKLKLSAETLRCLKMIQENRRFGELLQILDEFVHLYYRRGNVAEVEVESAVELSVAQSKKLVAVLEKQLAQKVVVTYKVYPELIGGLRIRVGSEMFDDTVASKLNRLEIMMKGEA